VDMTSHPNELEGKFRKFWRIRQRHGNTNHCSTASDIDPKSTRFRQQSCVSFDKSILNIFGFQDYSSL
jgi:hypothetical protein